MYDYTLSDFFISYAQEDWDWAKWISQQLEEASYSTILPSRDFRPGRNFVLEIDKATQAKRTLAVLSPNYLKSQFTQPEWAAALRLDPTGALGLLLPVRVSRCEVQGLLAQLIYIDLVGQEKEKARRILLSGIQQTPKKAKPAEFPAEQAPASVRSSATEQTQLTIARFGAPFPTHWNVPRRHVLYFTGRDEQIDQIFQEFMVHDPAQIAAAQALVGLGGLGKTQTAAEYAYRYRSEYQAVFWVRADAEENLLAGFQSLIRLLNLPAQADPVETMQSWFTANAGWLLILDNADDLDLMARFFPRSPRGHILLTTRVRASGNMAQPFLLEPLSSDDGALCILRRAGIISGHGQLSDVSPPNIVAATTISQLMDGLPLALEQAGAYIEDTGNSVSRYLRLYEEYREKIIQEHYGALPNYPLPVATAWEISKEIVRLENPAAFAFLQLCAFLAPEAIPEEIFTKGDAALGPVLAPLATNPLAIDKMTIILRKYSLLTREVNKEDDIARFSIHRVMQEILRDEMDETTRQLWAERAVRAVFLALPSVQWQIMQAQVLNCLPLIEKWNMAFPEAEHIRSMLKP
jgi:hypothetical protein